MNRNLENRHNALIYIPKFREYGIRVLNGGSAFQEIQFCPWCGKKLLPSLRDEWFSRLEKLNLDPDDPKVPKDFLSNAWWKK
jgi:hypothetical protein